MAGGILALWLGHDPYRELHQRLPGEDGRPARRAGGAVEAPVQIGELFTAFPGPPPSPLPGEWPRFRGADGTSTASGSVPLAEGWGEAGPPALWSVELGEGHAGPAVADSRVYVLDYDEARGADMLRCFALADGRELWQRGYRVEIKRNHGRSRTVPAVAGGYVVTVGPRCHVMCVEAVSGELKWGLDLVREYGGAEPLWYTGQCPLIDEGVAVLAPGGRALMIGVECAGGRVLWEVANPSGWQMSHSSIVPMTLLGRRMYVYCAVGGMVGVSAEAGDRGALLWSSTAWTQAVIAPSPVAVGPEHIYVTAGYGAGAALLRLRRDDDGYALDLVSRVKVTEGLCSEQQTPILHDGFLYAVLPKDAGPLRKQFVCARPERLDGFAWTSGKAARFGLGPCLLADGKFFILDDEGVLTVVRASASAYEPLWQGRVLPGPDSWGPMALAGGRLLVRDAWRLRCLDVRATGASKP